MSQASSHPQMISRSHQSNTGWKDPNALGPAYRQRITPLGQPFLSLQRLATVSQGQMTVLNLGSQATSSFDLLQRWPDGEISESGVIEPSLGIVEPGTVQRWSDDLSQISTDTSHSAAVDPQSAVSNHSHQNFIPQENRRESTPSLQKQDLSSEASVELQRQTDHQTDDTVNLQRNNSDQIEHRDLTPQSQSEHRPTLSPPSLQREVSESSAAGSSTPRARLSTPPPRLPSVIRRSPQLKHQVKQSKTQILRSLQAQAPHTNVNNSDGAVPVDRKSVV